MLDFPELVRAHQGAVCATAYAVLRDRARSEEVAQDAFLIAWRELPNMSPAPTLPAWICGIARNLARNAARKHKEVAMPEGADLASTENPLDTLLDREAHELAARALATLAERDREVVVLYYRGDQSVADVATALGITEPTARQRLHRGRERLRSAAAAVEATLRATRPGPAFALGCIAALAAGKSTPAAAATSGTTKAPWLAAGLGGALVLAVVAGGVVASTHGSAPPAAVGPMATVAPARQSPPPARPPKIPRITAAARLAALEQAHAARAGGSSRSAAGTTGTTGGAPEADQIKVYDFAESALRDVIPVEPPEPGILSKRTLRYGIELVQPLLLECYATGPHGAGTLQVRMRLVGAPPGATVIESVELGGDAALAGDATRMACLRDVLMTLEFPAMTEPGTWDVFYPLVVRAE